MRNRLVRILKFLSHEIEIIPPSIRKDYRNPDGTWKYAMTYRDKKEFQESGWKVRELSKHLECTYIILTVAHLDHNKRNNRFSNLKCLCQRCHFAHDRRDNVIRKRYGRNYDAAQIKINL